MKEKILNILKENSSYIPLTVDWANVLYSTRFDIVAHELEKIVDNEIKARSQIGVKMSASENVNSPSSPRATSNW